MTISKQTSAQRIAFALLGVLGVVAFICSVERAPRIVLWTWERNEDLSMVDPHTTSLAVLARSIELRHSGWIVRPRLNRLIAPPGIETIAVVRIDSDPGYVAPETERPRIAREVAAALPRGIRTLQVDYDARLSERAFYRDLLTRVRRELPPHSRLTITALASWCLDDDWIRDLPIDEAVPMLFEMGRGHRTVTAQLARGRDFKLPVCRQSLGLSVNEALPVAPRGRTLYFFSARPWSARTLAIANNARILP